MIKQLSPNAVVSKLPDQRWQIAIAQADQANAIAQATNLSPLLAQVLLNRGINFPEHAQRFLHPETEVLSSPLDDFTDLPPSQPQRLNLHQRQALHRLAQPPLKKK